ncbi:MAG: PQQ-binding-like beta-propeller repeat protein, partial [Dehalococcoidia bacterium]
MEQVRVCRFCGHVNPASSTSRCDNCDSFSGLIDVSPAEASQVTRRHHFRFLRSRLLRLAIAVALIVWGGVWGARFFFDLGPNPPGASTSISSAVGPQTWAQSRRTLQNAGFTPDQAPLPQRVKWTYATTQPLLAAPAVAAGRVYLTTEDGRALALEQETGQVIWEYHTGFPSNATPALAGGSVYFTLRPGLVVALDQDTGTLRWEKDIEDPILASPLVAEGTLYIGAADNRLYALDAATGEERWTFAASDWIISSVAYAEGRVVVTSQDSLVRVIDAKSGRRRLVYNAGRGRASPGGAVIQGEMAYFGSYGGRVWAIDRQAKTYPQDRAVLFWKSTLYIWGILSSPPVQRGSIWA